MYTTLRIRRSVSGARATRWAARSPRSSRAGSRRSPPPPRRSGFTVEEALVIRRAGITAPVLVLSGASDRAEAEAAIAADCALVVWDLDHARLIDTAAAAAGRTARVHFKVDTGLTRLGAPVAEAPARLKAIRELPHIEVEGLFTHL